MGQKNKITRRWARRGSRPSAPKDQRTKWAYVFGAICPAKGKGAGLVMPYADTHAMNEHLVEISATVAPGAHAVILVRPGRLAHDAETGCLEQLTLMELPLRAPELNRVENIWQFICENWLSNRVFGIIR